MRLTAQLGGGEVAECTLTRERAGLRAQKERSSAAAWFGAAVAVVLIWSLSYLLRQSSPAAGDPASPLGNFALEGALLALVWLGVLVAACLALLTGVATFEDPSAER